MAITSYGYDGTVLEAGWAKLAAYLGKRRPAIGGTDHFKPEIVTGVDRTVRVLTGEHYAHGVLAVNDAVLTVQAAVLASGTRWDTVVVRRDWQTNTTTVVIVTGTATKQIAAGINATPGTIADTPIALIQITAGQQAPTALLDLRPPFTEDAAAVGSEKFWPSDTPPAGWMVEDGRELDRVQYADLFAVIGTTYGAGNGSTTFNIPNAKGRVLVGKDAAQAEFDALGESGGAKTHVLAVGELPAHTHTLGGHSHGGGTAATNIDHQHVISHGHGRAYGATYGGGGGHSHAALATARAIYAAGGASAGLYAADYNTPTTTNGAHDHNSYADVPDFSGWSGVSGNTHSHGIAAENGNTSSVGSGTAHNNLQPYTVRNAIIRAF